MHVYVQNELLKMYGGERFIAPNLHIYLTE